MKYRRILLTGANGFVGTYLRTYLIGRVESVISMPEIYDIRDASGIQKYFSTISPDAVVHLAAKSFVPQSFANPRETYDTNFFGTLNLLDALKANNFTGTFLYVGSSDVYGVVQDALQPVAETVRFEPRSPYAVSKAAAELLCGQWANTEPSFRVVIARPFNHIGPGQDERFVISRLCRQVAAIKMGLQPPIIQVGNLDVTRDFTDVRDVIRAYYLLLRFGESGSAYNVCSGREVLLAGILPQIQKISRVDFEVSILPELFRPTEQSRVRGDFNKINSLTGWRPKISLQDSLLDIYTYWESKLKTEC